MRKTFLTLACCFCASASATTVLDDRQQAIHIPAAPQRIVSLLPSLTESVCVLGRCERLVGVDRYSNWHASVRSVPVVGGGLDPSIESIVSLKPDLVLAAGSTRGAERLEALQVHLLSQANLSLKDPQSVEVKQLLQQQTQQAIDLGLFGVPSVVVNGQVFWGQDALPMLRAYLQGDAWFESADWLDVGKLPVGIRRTPASK
jgi:iron complex transport system substrate-binding protein